MQSGKSNKYDGIIGLFAHHKVAANLLMVILLLSGGYALTKLNVQFFPNFALDYINVQVAWPGASSEDVRTGITIPLEQRLRTVDGLKEMTSVSAEGVSSILLEYPEGTDMLLALDQARRQVDEFRNFPADAELPSVIKIVNYELVAKILISGGKDIEALRRLSNQYEVELLNSGVDKVDIFGLPDKEISIEVGTQSLNQIGLSVNQVAQRIQDQSRDTPSGVLGQSESARDLRSLDQRRTAEAFSRIPVVSDSTARIELGDIASVREQLSENQPYISYQGQAAVELSLQRAESGDSLESAKALQAWLEKTRANLPEGISLIVYDEQWTLIKERITLLLKNGLGGLLLIILILYLFLSGRVAFWVMLGIPISFMGTLFIMHMSGGSINMISLFALIMALGIIVDDAIVVGEDAQAHHQMGEHPLKAAEGGARRMLAPVMASSLSTMAAFLPLMLIGGIIGNILVALPIVVMTVILASVIESFLILPGHLRHAFVHQRDIKAGSLRARLDHAFAYFRDKKFRPSVKLALRFRAITIAIAVSILMLSVGLLAGGKIKFQFFPSPESQVIHANATFVAGTPEEPVMAFMQHVNQALRETEAELGGNLVEIAIGKHRMASGDSNGGSATGAHVASIQISLLPPDQREVRNEVFINEWRSRIRLPAGLENFTLSSRRAGPPGRDISIRMTGSDPQTMKRAALEFREALKSIPGVGDSLDDMPYGREQLIYQLTPAGEALGLTSAEIGRQLRSAFSGQLIQIFQDGADEVEVWVRLPKSEREQLDVLERINISTPAGLLVPLMTVTDWSSSQGFEVLRQTNGFLSINIQADVDSTQANAQEINDNLKETTLPLLAEKYGINFSFEGRAKDSAETMADMRTGLLLGLTLIYIILAWVFSSYSWPLVVMAAIPFGLTGAIIGHWLTGIDLTILSLFGIFGLSGIVVNDSIILVTFYKQLRNEGLPLHAALVTASCLRLRAILLTSLTTIAGLTPLLFETSLQAQFLVPMATSIAFGLAYATLLILFVIPAILSYVEDIREWVSNSDKKHQQVAPSV